MSAELQIDYITGKNVYFLLRNATGSVWNGSSFVAYNTANLGDYDIAASEQGTASGYFTADMPAAAAGVYYALAKERIGGSPAEGDPTIGTGTIQWTGSAVAPSGLEAVLVESGISASSALTNDSGTQLTAINAKQALAAVLSACCAVLAGAATTNVTVRPAAKPAASNRLDAVVDTSGNRTSVSLKVPD